ncbi:hypothetical protein [Flavobacterium sp. FlaQc-47]|uniref:hypothetical protein n=1 Tax=Flavobacterium sp. FlaQc-47 TaxID=3374180 RepID=UPI0037567E98
MSKQQEKELFFFLLNKQSYFDLIFAEFKINFSKELSVDNLIKLENEIIKRKRLINEEIKIAFSFLVGEIIIKELNGNWAICSVKKDPSYNLPIILNWGKSGEDNMRLSPVEWIELFISEKIRLGTISAMILQNK